MFCDEYFLLRRQNRRDLRALADGDREVLRGIARRLDDATWNSYEAQRVLRALIDLAARAGQEGRPLTEALGKDPAGTVDELCAAIDPGTPLDRLLAGLGVLLALALVVAVPCLVRPVDVQAPAWALSLGFFALAAASWAVRTARYNACARRRPWRESAQAPRAR